jgi:hypothetical protein
MLMRVRSTLTLFFVLACCQTAGAEQPGLVGHWSFDEGQGSILHDHSEHQNHGQVHGARWVNCGDGHALQFDGFDDFVDCGNHSSLDIRGPVTLSAWIRPATASAKEPGVVGKYFDSYALTLYRGGCWWYISSGGNNVATSLKTGQWHHVVGTFDGQRMRLYVNGVEQANKRSKYRQVAQGKNLLMGRVVPDPDAANAASHARGHFQGLLDEVKVFNRALSMAEVAAEFNRHALQKGLKPVDTSWFGRFRLTQYSYPKTDRLVVDVDYRGLLPIADDARIFVDLVRSPQGDPIQRRELAPNVDQPRAEVTFTITDSIDGGYLLRAALKSVSGDVTQIAKAATQRPPVDELPTPRQQVAPPLPRVPQPVRFEVSVRPGGGFVVGIKGKEYPVESSYSFPHGGESRLAVSETADKRGQRDWQVRVKQLDAKNFEVLAGGQYYSIRRRIVVKANRISVRDQITNLTPDVLGIIVSNHIKTDSDAKIAVETPGNFTMFVAGADHGLAVVALDDVYQLQQETLYRNNLAAMVTDKFGLDRGASYTVEWDVYPTATPDYYEFVNRFRKVEDLNRTVGGAFGLIGDGEGLVRSDNRRFAPSPDVIEAKGLKYVSYHYLIGPEDDPGMSLEGIEFTQYPKECALLKKTFAEAHQLNPGMKVMFHIAHGLYATNVPEKLFPDSRVIDAHGKQIMYGPNSADYYCRYFSRKRFDEGYRWWIFYPTMDNSFGKAMLEAVDFMLDEIGASAMYADGFVSGYAGTGYTYDRWDGHSVQIDPTTKTVARKMGNVTLMALPVLKAVTRKVAAKGGTVFTNGRAGPRSLWPENYITTAETSGGDQLPIMRQYLGPAVTAFGDPTRIKTRRDLYLDVLSKISWGALYFYYGDKNLGVEEKTIVPYMYPFTLEELHAGWMKGQERIITRVPGVYGWRGDTSLHYVVYSDARGIIVPNLCFSTADADQVRTHLPLADLECAVVIRVPARLETSEPVNVLVQQYDVSGVRLRLNGTGHIRLEFTSGEFRVEPNAKFVVVTDKTETVTADDDGRLILPLDLTGHTAVQITPARS